MARYIDADAFDVILLPDSSEEFAEGVQYAMELLDKAPTVDAVEVVRCKDCVWWGKAGCAILIVDESDKPKENDFCAFGERKEKGDGRT